MAKEKRGETSKTMTIVLAILAVGLIAIGALLYTNLRRGRTDPNSFKYKQSQIDECMRNGPTFTDQPTLEENYQKKLDYCTQLNR